MVTDLKRNMNLSRDKILDLYRVMVKIRQFEDTVYYAFLEGKLPGSVHLYQGQEAIASGVCANLRKEDVILSTHRPHGHAIAKGVPIKYCMAELYAKSTGCCKGKGGSMHLGDISVGMVPAIAITGGSMPIATGCALAFKYQKKDNVAISFFGDGATNEGAFHEALNMAAIWDLPVIFICENNLYGASTHVSKVMKVKNIVDRAVGYGLPGNVVDGNDVLEVYSNVEKAVNRARKGEGPTFLECKTYRIGGHSRGDANQYRDKEEEKIWLSRDPLIIAQNKLKEMDVLNDEMIEIINQEIKNEIDEAVRFAVESPSPRPEDCLEDVLAK